jgi:hypothetical protein
MEVSGSYLDTAVLHAVVLMHLNRYYIDLNLLLIVFMHLNRNYIDLNLLLIVFMHL